MFGIPHRAMVHDEQVISYDAQERLRPYTYFSVIDTDEFIVPVNQSVTSFVELMASIYELCCVEKGVLIHLQKVSNHVSLRSPRRLTWVDTFCYRSIFLLI